MRVIYIDLDTTRPDHLGCYGYHRNTSPNVDAVAAEGVRFEGFHCSDAPCLPSRTALMTGQFGIHTGVVNHGGLAADPRHEGSPRGFKDSLCTDSLPMIFRRAGMKTVSVSPFAERHSAWSFNAGFNETHNTGKSGNESAEEVSPVVLDWLERNADSDNWFLHVNFWDAHAPYRAPMDFGNPVDGDATPAWLTQEKLDRQRTAPHPHGPQELNMFDNKTRPQFPRALGELKTMDDVRRHVDGYDVGIRYSDHHVGLLLDVLRKKGIYDDIAIIISADHGENQGELGIYCEHGTADEITTRIPFIIKWPGARPGHVDKGLHYNVDLAPTLAELMNQAARPSWDGRSFAASVTDGADTGRDFLVLSQCAHVCQRSVRFDDWIYIRTWHDGFHLFPKEMLFNLKDDPHEEHNLAAERPDLCRQAASMYLDWHDEQMNGMDSEIDPLWTVMKEGGPYHARGRMRGTRYDERLEETGRGSHLEELKRRHPREFGISPEDPLYFSKR